MGVRGREMSLVPRSGREKRSGREEKEEIARGRLGFGQLCGFRREKGSRWRRCSGSVKRRGGEIGKGRGEPVWFQQEGLDGIDEIRPRRARQKNIGLGEEQGVSVRVKIGHRSLGLSREREDRLRRRGRSGKFWVGGAVCAGIYGWKLSSKEAEARERVPSGSVRTSTGAGLSVRCRVGVGLRRRGEEEGSVERGRERAGVAQVAGARGRTCSARAGVSSGEGKIVR